MLHLLEKQNYFLEYKPHKNKEKDPRLHGNVNVYILSDAELEEHDLHLYYILSRFDLLITDYSSIFNEAALLVIPLVF
ncbi:hypothetical protein GF319_12735 [Candidatus Bathyarchaeota archaeon]|nr:hypothetical protein [Candidatus Bathyarchaeota archaeon]